MVQEYLRRLKSNPHVIPLLIVLLAAALGQAATLIQHQIVAATFPDTASYLQAAHALLASPKNLIQAFRTPGYPLFLATIFTFTGSEHLGRVVAVQILLSLLAVLECYVLALRLSHRRWIACLTASAIGVNLYILSWERTVLSESLSWWILITLFLCYERFIRRPGFGWGAAVAAVGFAATMIRPFNVFIPFLLLLLALLRAWRTREFRVYWKPAGAAAAVLCVCLLSYMGLNASFNGFLGLSYVPNVNLLGKVMEYHMQDLPVAPHYAAIQADVHAYVLARHTEPWVFANLYPTKHYAADNWSYAGGYAWYIIVHHPGTFLIDSIPDLYNAWLAAGVFYPAYTYKPTWFITLLNVSRVELDLYWLLPVLLIVLGVWVWRRPKHSDRFLMLALALMVVGDIVLAALGDYTEFYRMRSPVDWAMILLAGIVLAEGLVSVAQREHPSSTGAVPGKAGSERGPADQTQAVEGLTPQQALMADQETLKLSIQQIRDGSQIENDP